jgi:hypothetical protein
MKTFACAVMVTAAVLLAGAAPAGAFTCPVVIKQAEDLIKKAEAGKVTPETRPLIDEARKMVGEARHHHETARGKTDHAAAVRKAKVAIALAEEVITLQAP